MLEHLCYHVAHIQVCVSNIKRVTATFCSAVLSSHFDHVFFTFYVSDHVFSLSWPSVTTFYNFLTLVILTMLHSLFRFSSLLTCLTMFFHCFGPLLPLFIFFLPWSFWPCCTHFSGFLHFWRVWPCFFTVLALCYHFLYFSYLGHFDHVALTFQVFLTFFVSDHVFSLFRFSFYVSDHVFSLLWPSATTFYIFLTLVILTMLHSLFRFSSLLTCLTMFFHCFGPLLPLFIFFLPWSFWPCCTHFSGFLHFWRVWPCFFTVLALCYHFLYFSYLGHFDHVALTFQVFFTFYVSDHVFSLFRFSSLFTCLTIFFTVLALCYHFLYFSYLGHFDHVALTFQVFFTFYVSDHVFSLFGPLLPLFICLPLVILIMLRSLFRLFHNAIRCLTPLLPCGTYSSLCEQY